MNNTARLLLALGFAGFAVFMNFVWIQYNSRVTEYTVYKTDIKQGAVLESLQQLSSVKLSERPGFKNKDVFVPWKDNVALLGKVSRDIKEGEMALQSDITGKVIPPKTDRLGPFTVKSVLDKNADGTSVGEAIGRTLMTITVPVDENGKFDKNTDQLLHILDLDRRSDSRGGSLIQGISPGSASENRDQYTGRTTDVFIDLPNSIPFIRDAILEGGAIYFIVSESLIPTN